MSGPSRPRGSVARTMRLSVGGGDVEEEPVVAWRSPGETATPSSPPSPAGAAASTTADLARPRASGPWMRQHPRGVSRSVTIASPFGRKPRPQGTARPRAIGADHPGGPGGRTAAARPGTDGRRSGGSRAGRRRGRVRGRGGDRVARGAPSSVPPEQPPSASAARTRQHRRPAARQDTRSRKSSSSCVHPVRLLHLDEVAAAQLDVRRAARCRVGRGRHVPGAGQQVEGAGDEARSGTVMPLSETRACSGGAQGEVEVPLDRGREELGDGDGGQLGVGHREHEAGAGQQRRWCAGRPAAGRRSGSAPGRRA